MSIRSRAAASSPMEGAIHGGWGVNRQYDRAKISVQFSIYGDLRSNSNGRQMYISIEVNMQLLYLLLLLLHKVLFS